MKKRDILLSILSGLILIFSFPNFDLEFLAWFALVPLLSALEEKTLLQSLLLGWITGFVSFLGILYWIIVAVHTYGNVPLIMSGLILLLLVAYLSLYFGTFTFLLRFLQGRLGLHIIVLGPFLWVSLEYLRSFLLTGFPWANLAHSQYLNLPFIQMADITGVYGLSFTIFLVNVTVYWILHQWPKKIFPYREAVITVIIVSGLLVYGVLRMGPISRRALQQPTLKVG